MGLCSVVYAEVSLDSWAKDGITCVSMTALVKFWVAHKKKLKLTELVNSNLENGKIFINT
jgi:hypothetical protein